MKKILLINPYGIGDALFTTPVISTIKLNFPDSILGYWCNNRVKNLFKNDQNINKIFALSRGDLKNIYKNSKLEGIKEFLCLASNIKKERFDISLDFSQDHRYSLISKLLGIKKRVGFNYKNRGRFLTDKIDIDGYTDKHVVEYYLDLLKFLGIEQKKYNLYLDVSKSDRLKSKILKLTALGERDLAVGIVPGAGASWGKDAGLKHWPVSFYAQLADKIIDVFNAKILILADAQERSLAARVLAAMRNKATDLAGKLDLEELIAAINNLHLLITNDGGPLHIAAALGKKTISFFGPVDQKVYGPYPPDEKSHIVLRKDLDCSPCYVNFRLNPCQRNKECLKTIDVPEAFGAVRRLLG